MSKIEQKIKNFQTKFSGTSARLIAVSKTHPPEAIQAAYAAGQRAFGENKVQEMVAKYELLPKDIEWHLIGHLQRNKVKYIAPFVHLIHSVDSFKLLREINKEGAKAGRVIPCLLQIHIAEEENKFGFDRKELLDMLDHPDFQSLQNIAIKGLMGMATFTENEEKIRREFQSLKNLSTEITEKYPNIPFLKMNELSMGMSNDFHIAIEEGATLIRVGSAIFGERDYSN
jgi:pyridoxal phosphate enzyme (YggS family)